MTQDPSLLPFGDRLRQLRKPRMTGAHLAELAGWQPSKVSRIENGQQQITEEDLAKWGELLGLSEAERKELRDELRGVRLDQSRWKSRLRTGGHEVVQQSFGDAEKSATRICDFETSLVPGLVQTPDYARAVFAAMSALKGAQDDPDAAVAARLQRQAILYDSTKTIELLVTEAALRMPVAPTGVMAGQIDRLLAVIGVPSVRFGIIPLGVQIRYPALHGFWILDDWVRVEVVNTAIATRDPADLQLYSDLLASLWESAVEGDAARAVLLAVSESYRPLT